MGGYAHVQEPVPFTAPPSVSGVDVFIQGTPSFSPVTIMTQ